MARYRKILVAYDGSASAKHALSLASQLARENKSWIKVVAVVPTYEGDLELIGVANIKETITGPGKKLLAEAQAIAEREDINILTNLEQGEPYEQIVHVADDEGCNLIVMGRRGQSNLEREFMGGVTARVIGHSNRDVLVIPDTAKLGWKNLLLATDGSPYSGAAVDKAIDLAKEHNAKLTAISVVYSNDEFYTLGHEALSELIEKAKAMLAEVGNKAAAAGVEIETVVKEGEPHQAITDLAVDAGADMVVMGSHGRKGLTRLLMGSVTAKVIGFAQCPVLVSHL